MTTRSTSQAAFASAKRSLPTIKERALTQIKGSKGGMTADEVAEALGLSVLSVRPSVTYLYNDNLVTDSGDRRPNISGKNAIVWVAC